MALQPRFTITKACQINLITNYCINYLLQCTQCAVYTFDVFIFVMPSPTPVLVTDPRWSADSSLGTLYKITGLAWPNVVYRSLSRSSWRVFCSQDILSSLISVLFRYISTLIVTLLSLSAERWRSLGIEKILCSGVVRSYFWLEW